MKNLNNATTDRKTGKPVIIEKKVFATKDYLFFSLLTIVGYTAIIYFLLPWFSTKDRAVYPIAFWLLTFVFFGKLFVSQLRWWLLPFMKKPLPIRPKIGWRVGAVTTFVPGAESLQMLEETLRAMIAMDYPHETWVLDEGDNPAVKDLCKNLGAYHFSRKDRPEYQTESGTFEARTKHGNYNSWLYEIGFERYDIIAAFDPDHIPEKNFITESLGYFNDPKVGYVQAAQVYYNQKASFIARGAAEETYAYYSSTQMFCYAMGYPIVTGCHTTHRVSSLREAGGFAAHDADDLLITLLYRTSGWKGVYIPKILARGLTPVDWNSYLGQQFRWARSVLDIKFRIHPKMLGKLQFKETVVSLLHGYYYLQGATTLILLLLLAYLLATASIPKVVELFFSLNFFVLFAVMMICEFYRQSFYIDRKNEWGLHWRTLLLQFAKYPYLISALFCVILNRRAGYSLTSKTRIKKTSRSLRPFLPHLIVAAIICASWIFGIIINGNLPPKLHLAAFAALSGTLMLVGTGYMEFPAPFDPKLIPPSEKRTLPEPAFAGANKRSFNLNF